MHNSMNAMRFQMHPLVRRGANKLFIIISHPHRRRRSSTFIRAFSSASDHQRRNHSRGGLPRFFSDVLPSSKGEAVRVQGDEFWHMTKVLRLGVNERVELFNGKGGLVEGSIERIDRSGVELVACETPRLVHFCGTEWHVFAAFGTFRLRETKYFVFNVAQSIVITTANLTCSGTLKGGRADWLVEKCTELGASSVTPLLTDRSPSISENRADRLQRVVVAASKQCQRLHEMILNPPVHINNIKTNVAQSKLAFVATAEATPVLSVLSSSAKESKGSLIVGPEGDFTEKELKTMIGVGVSPVGLGPHRLRVETATVALLTAVMLWSDSQG